MKIFTTRIKDAHGDTVHIYRNVEITLNKFVLAGDYGRYSFKCNGAQSAGTLAHAKQKIDASLTN
jgi:hypothetical protein